MQDKEDLSFLKKASKNDMYLVFIGGCGAFGMNLTCYIYNEKLYIVDAGVLFPDPHFLGVDAMIPDMTSLCRVFGGPSAYIITHGHEDHIGAIPSLLESWPAPVYATSWTMALIRGKLAQYGLSEGSYELHDIKVNEKRVIGELTCCWYHVNHSIPMTASLSIESENFRLFHTGDFKFEKAPLYEAPADLLGIKAFAGEKSVDVLITDSTNALSAGRSGQEKDVEAALLPLLTQRSGRTYLALFASNLWRIMTVARLCQKLGIKVAVSGASLLKTLDLASSFGMIKEGLLSSLVAPSKLEGYERKDTLVITTGSQAEHKASLSRIVRGEHRELNLLPSDRVILSSRMIPGNEKAVYSMISQCVQQSVTVITTKTHPNIHVSGHAHKEELSELISIIKPTYYVPVHGTHTQMVANGSLGEEASKVVSIENGNVLKLTREDLEAVGSIGTDKFFLDSFSKVPLSYQTLRERLKIGDSGVIHLTGVYHRKLDRWLKPVSMDFRGLDLPRRIDKAAWRQEVFGQIEDFISQNIQMDESAVLEEVRRLVRRRVSVYLVKKPVVMNFINLLSEGFDG